jgi:oxygen-dependent protoporphyrinogen oxidase
MSDPRRTAVVGAGIAGLTAARELVATGREVTVLEGSPRIGGKLMTNEVAGISVDVGAESMLARRPEGVELARGVGLEVVHPATTSSAVWTREALRPLPRSVMGVPGDLDAVAAAGILSSAGLDRLRSEIRGPALDDGEDVSVGELVAARLGDEVVDRLVEPLLGGVYAGHARNLSARATVPQLVAWAHGSLVTAAAATLDAATGAPVFAGIPGGLGRLPAALASGLDVRTETTVRRLRRSPDGFVLVVGATTSAAEVTVDEVVVATPATPAARLLADLAPVAAAELAGIEHASMAVVTLAFREADLPALPGSGFLVPPVDGRTIKAATFSFNKWGWVREAGAGLLVMRTSIGRHREESVLQVPDDELVAMSLRELGEATGLSARPVDRLVQRWGGGLPQYAVGHLDKVARIRADVARVPGLTVCGAAYDGVGIPAVVGSARRAATELAQAQ